MKYIKKLRVNFILFGLIFGFSLFFFQSHPLEAKDVYENAYLACFIDETTHTYRTQVIYSGVDIEYSHVTFLWGEALHMGPDTEHVGLVGLKATYGGDYYVTGSVHEGSGESTDGRTEIHFKSQNEPDGEDLLTSDIDYTKFEGNDNPVRPLTFPSEYRNCNANDINRAYEVQDAISTDFTNALSYINDGNDFVSTQSLVQTAYYLVTADDGTIITNGYGNQYKIKYNAYNENGYKYYLTISSVKEPNNSKRFCYKVKKGYANCTRDEKMENDQGNMIAEPDSNDTTWITWEHLFIEAGTLYAEGIMYESQQDLYNISSFEESIVGLFRDLFNGLRSWLQLYTFEDLIFNQGTRSSNAFTYGVYATSWNDNLVIVYLIFTAIAISLLTLTCINFLMKRQLSTIMIAERVSMMNMIKNVILAFLMIIFGWILMKLFLLINAKFVDVFAVLTENKSLVQSYSAYSTLSAIVYQFAYFVITFYANYLYILRSLVIPALIVSAPLFFWGFSMGPIGERIFSAWLKELIGNIYIQLFHAFIYGFILMCSTGMRGIESLVVCAAIIPLTRIFKDITGVGGDNILNTANSLTGTSVSMGLGAASVATQVAGSGISALATMTGNPMIAAVGNGIDTAMTVGAGTMQSMGGAATNFALEGNIGAGISNAGLNTISRELSKPNYPLMMGNGDSSPDSDKNISSIGAFLQNRSDSNPISSVTGMPVNAVPNRQSEYNKMANEYGTAPNYMNHQAANKINNNDRLGSFTRTNSFDQKTGKAYQLTDHKTSVSDLNDTTANAYQVGVIRAINRYTEADKELTTLNQRRANKEYVPKAEFTRTMNRYNTARRDYSNICKEHGYAEMAVRQEGNTYHIMGFREDNKVT